MSELKAVARPYARALYELAVADNSLQQWSNDLQQLVALVNLDNVQLWLKHPQTQADSVAETIIKTCDIQPQSQLANFLRLLAHNHRVLALEAIYQVFEELRLEHEKQMDVAVTSATPLSEGEQEQLKAALEKRFDRAVNMKVKVDASLIAGVLIQAGTKVIDGTVKGRLSRLFNYLNLKEALCK